jgi:hypothetical protein
VKKYFSLISLCFIIVLAFAVNVFAITATSTATEITLTYDEPTTNADNTPLTDLDHINIYQDSIKLPITSPATAANGGGKAIVVKIITSTTGKVISFYATAVDKTGNESIPSLTVTVDRLAPAPVQ